MKTGSLLFKITIKPGKAFTQLTKPLTGRTKNACKVNIIVGSSKMMDGISKRL
jgi:hypothetical protein